jgi:hypothetical protein
MKKDSFIATWPVARHLGGMVSKSPLDDPENARHAWDRFRKIMRIVGVVAFVAVTVSLGILFAVNGFVSIHLYIAAALGIGLSVLLAGALMGLVFLSSGTNHDAAVDNRLPGMGEEDGLSR